MNLRDFRRAGHWPTLLCAFLYFDISFMVWVMLGALANSIAPDLGLTDAQKGLMVAVPLLGGAVLRLVLGPLADHIGGRRTGMIGMVATIVPLCLGWLWADSYAEVLIVGLMLGVAGASFAVALPLASRWYPPKYQGLAMGIAGAGNSGTALATFFAPRLAAQWDWHVVFGLALLPVAATFVLFALFAKDSPRRPAPKSLSDYTGLVRMRDTWWFCLFYSVTFGGFVGLASFLGILFRDLYGLSPIAAGGFTTLCVVSGSMLRPVGGYLSDRFGGIRMLVILYVGVSVTLLGMAVLPPLSIATLLLFVCMGCLGMGNGAVFQIVPQRFPNQIGVITGIVGAAGGVGGFLLPTILGGVKQASGSFASGFVLFSLVALVSAVALLKVSRAWEGVFIGRGGLASSAAESIPAPHELAGATTLQAAEA